MHPQLVCLKGNTLLRRQYDNWGLVMMCSLNIDFIDGTETGFMEMATLHKFLCKLRLPRNSERHVERPHAHSMREIKRARNHKEVTVALCHRFRPMIEHCSHQKLADILSDMKSAADGVAKLGLANHPFLNRLPGLGIRDNNKYLITIVYNGDPWSKYTFQPPAAKAVRIERLEALNSSTIHCHNMAGLVHTLALQHIAQRVTRLQNSDEGSPDTFDRVADFIGVPLHAHVVSTMVMALRPQSGYTADASGEISIQSSQTQLLDEGAIKELPVEKGVVINVLLMKIVSARILRFIRERVHGSSDLTKD